MASRSGPRLTRRVNRAAGAVRTSRARRRRVGRAFVTVRGEHFYSGDKRLRFWGVNFCFSGCFPAHQQADALAQRLARFGVNAVRFHHMDSAPFPGGIFTDQKLETLSPEALQYRTFEVVGILFERMAEEAPVVLAVEDLHWADPTSVQLLERILPVVESAAGKSQRRAKQ